MKTIITSDKPIDCDSCYGRGLFAEGFSKKVVPCPKCGSVGWEYFRQEKENGKLFYIVKVSWLKKLFG